MAIVMMKIKHGVVINFAMIMMVMIVKNNNLVKHVQIVNLISQTMVLSVAILLGMHLVSIVLT